MSTQTIHEDANHTPTAATVNLKLEVVVIPVSDVDRAKRFYESLGWRLDADFANGKDWRLVQMTPPGSPCSVMFGKGFTTAAPGSVQGTFLVVDDIAAARAELIGHGVDVSEVFHFEGDLHVSSGRTGRVPGRTRKAAPTSRSPHSAIRTATAGCCRRSRRGFPDEDSALDVATLTELLRETEKRHGAYEPTAPKHHWSDWYAAYIVARAAAGGLPTRRRRTPRSTWNGLRSPPGSKGRLGRVTLSPGAERRRRSSNCADRRD